MAGIYQIGGPNQGSGAKVTYQVRTKQTGSFDKATKCWRFRGQGIHAIVKQLQDRYRVTFTATEPAKLERESAPDW